MTPLHPLEALPRTARALRLAVDEIRDVRMAHDMNPTDSSPMRSELERAARFFDPGADPFNYFQVRVLLLMASLDDHIEALAETLPSHLHMWALGTLTRGAVEAASRASWLLDPGIDVGRRLARAATDDVYSWYEFRKLSEGGDEQLGDDRYREAVESAREIAERFDLPYLDAAGPPAVAERRPSSTDLIEKMTIPGAGRMAYRLLSGGAHGTTYGLSMGVFETDESPASDRRLDVLSLYISTAITAYEAANPRRDAIFRLDARKSLCLLE